jgi:endonuclease/exonuclease/phosphatase family metal-dependent hydrolase
MSWVRWFPVVCIAALAGAGGACADQVTTDTGYAGPDCTNGGCRDAGTHSDARARDGAPSDNTEQPDGSELPAPLKGDSNLRIVASNLSTGSQAYGDVGIRLLKGIHPDVALMQEFNYGNNSEADLRKFVDTTFGTGFFVFRETGATIPNGVVSRFPIAASGEWADPLSNNTRDFVWARIDIPGDIDLWAISVHLLTGSSRSAQATALVKLINDNIPKGDYIALGGDFNTDTRGETCIKTFETVFGSAAVTAPFPQDEAGNTNTNINRNKPYDWVLANPALLARRVITQIGEKKFESGLVFDSRVYQPLSDVAPVQANDSTAQNQMQHMAVVKDFLVE